MPRISTCLLLSTLVAGPVCGQCASVTTMTSSGNGNDGTMFNVVNVSPTALIIGSFDQCFFSSTPASNNMFVYTKTGTWSGFENTPAAWTLIGGPVVTPHGAAPSLDPIPIPINVTIGPGATQAFYITGDPPTTVAYTDGIAQIGAVIGSNTDLQVLGGIGKAYPFGSSAGLPTNGRLWNGRINYCPATTGTVLGTNTSLGVGCYAKPTSFYEFTAAPPTGFDLSNTSFTMTPSGGGYVVASGGSFIPVGTTSAPVIIAVGDDVEEPNVPLAAMGSFPALTGPVTSLTVCSNGYVSTATGNGTLWTPEVTPFLNAPRTTWRVWHDFANQLGGSVKFEESPTVTVITWDNVRHWGGSGPADDSTFQMQFYPSGAVTFAFLTMSTATNPILLDGAAYLVGYSPGGNSLNAGSTDISAALAGAGTIVTQPADIAPLTLTATTRPITGTNWNFTVSSIPAGSPFGISIFGIADPGIPSLFFLGAPGCPLRSTLELVDGPFLIGGSSVNTTFAIPASPTLLNFHLFTQAAVWTIPPQNAFGIVTSGGVDGMIGDY